jgi:hypothetical protein
MDAKASIGKKSQFPVPCFPDALAELFQTTQQNVSQHILNIYEEGELEPGATYKKFLSVRREGSRQVQRSLDFYLEELCQQHGVNAGKVVKLLDTEKRGLAASWKEILR